jgi:hypothetical protein
MKTNRTRWMLLGLSAAALTGCGDHSDYAHAVQMRLVDKPFYVLW